LRESSAAGDRVARVDAKLIVVINFGKSGAAGDRNGRGNR
jgi:hypothetical protein